MTRAIGFNGFGEACIHADRGVAEAVRVVDWRACDARVYEPHIRARLGTTAQFCKVVICVHLTGFRVSG